MEEKIVKVLNVMSEYLSITQMKKLQEVIIKTFADNEACKIEISNEINNSLIKTITGELKLKYKQGSLTYEYDEIINEQIKFDSVLISEVAADLIEDNYKKQIGLFDHDNLFDKLKLETKYNKIFARAIIMN